MSDESEPNRSNEPSGGSTTHTETPASDQLELKLPDESSAPRDLGMWTGVLMLLVLVAYWPATSGKFLWGDRHLVTDNLWVRFPGGITDSWTQRWKQTDRYPFSLYQPVTLSAYWLEYRLGGHADPTGSSTLPPAPTPTAFHLGNLVFHACAAALLWLVLRELLVPGAWVIAAVFAVHPLNAEPVSWIADQAWPLGGLLFFGSAYLYLRFVKHRERDAVDRAGGGAGVDPVVTWGFFAGAAGAFVLAMLANPATLPLPIALLLILWWRRRLVSQDSSLLVPLLIVGAILWLLSADLKAQGTASLWHRGWAAQLGAVGSALFSCIRIAVPLSLNLFHDQWTAEQWWLGAIALLCWAGVTGLFWTARDRWGRGLFVASVIFGLGEILSLNWFDPFRRAETTDAGTYLSTAPIIALIVVLIINRLKNARLPATFAQIAVTLSAISLVVLGTASWSRAHVFDNPVAFWQDAAFKNQQSSFVLSQLAEDLRLRAIEEGSVGDNDGVKNDLNASMSDAQKAITANPINAEAERTWANVLVSQGDVKSALPHFQKAADIVPDDFDTLSHYGSALDAIAMFKQAIPQIDAALRVEPSSAVAHHLLGIAYGGLNDEIRAISELQLSLQLDPSDLTTRESLAEQQAKAGQLDEAIKNYSACMEIEPANRTRPELWKAIARIRERQGAWDQALDWYNGALKLDPGNAELKKSIEIDTIKAKAQAATRPATRPAASNQPATR